MFFEDEKDIIREGADIHIDEDGTVTWEDVLNTDDDDIPALNSTATNQKADSELELVQSEEEIDEQELMQILNESKANAQQAQEVAPAQEAEDFDIDSQLANVVLEQNKDEQEDIKPRKTEKKQAAQTSPLLMAVLFAAIIACGVYYGMQFLQNNNTLNQVSQSELPVRPSPQQEMNEVTQEDLSQRQAQQEVAPENIPVVNEEEVKEIKPQEEPKKEKQQEKKQVINVIPTGRSNPFMPISKYATTSIPETAIQYDKSGIPKPPEAYGIKEETEQLMSIAVSGIMYDENKPSAIVTYDNNDYFVQKGDKLDNYKIVDISKTYVMIALGNNVYKANIGEEFKVSSKFDGSAQYIPQTQGGGRQYYSITDRNSRERDQHGPRYVSEDDIKINAR